MPRQMIERGNALRNELLFEAVSLGCKSQTLLTIPGCTYCDFGGLDRHFSESVAKNDAFESAFVVCLRKEAHH